MSDNIPLKKTRKKTVIPLDTASPTVGIDALNLKRPKKEDEEAPLEPEKPVSAGFKAADGSTAKLVEYMFNASKDKLREVTIISREQGKLLPQLDIVNGMLHYVVEIAQFRQNQAVYYKLYKRARPLCPDVFDDFIHRTAQWQKSVNGVNLHEGVNIALAEVESRQQENDFYPGGDGGMRE